MRQAIAWDHRPFVVTCDEGAGSIILEACGHAARIGPEGAKRLAWVERSIREADGGRVAIEDVPTPY